MKQFCYHLAKKSLKNKIRENFDEDFETFKRMVQTMWGCHDDVLPLVNNPDTTRCSESTQIRDMRRYNNQIYANRN